MTTLQYTPPETVKEFIKHHLPGELFADWIVGPVGCVAGDTIILTENGPIPIADIDRPMRVLSWNAKSCQFQLSWCGGSFPKGRDYLYRVSTLEGEFDAAGHHLMLCADGEYRRVDHLRPGDVVVTCSRSRQLTNAELSPPTSVLSAQRYSRTVVDSMGHYAESARLHGQQFLQEEGTGLAVVPSQAGARGCAEYSSQASMGRMDGLQEQTHTHIHQEQYADRQRMMRSEIQWGNVGVAAAGRDGSESYVHSLVRFQESALSLSNCDCHPLVPLRGELSLLKQGSEPYVNPSLRTTNRTIVSVERREVKQAFWDMQVADTNNYVTLDGTIHHNSGKTTGIFFKLVYMAGLQAKSPRDGIRRSRCVVVRSTGNQLNDTTIKSFNYWFQDGTAGKWKATEKTFILRFGDVECEVLFRPLDTPDDVNRVLSLEVTFAIVDEFVDTPKEIIEALSARCGRFPPEIDGGATNWGLWGASNPGMETDWWYPMLEDHSALPEDILPADNWKYFKQPSGLSDAAENLDNLPGKAGYYTNLMKGKTSHWIKQFIEVQWGYSLNGKPVFPMFSKDYHVAKGSLRYDPSLPLVAGYDPGMQSAVILGQQDKWGCVRILAELVLEDYSTDRMIAEQLKPLLARKFPNCEFLIIPDPASGNRSQASNTSVMKELKKHFEVKVDTDNKIESRLAPAQHYMMKRTSGGEALQIDPSCVRLIRALTGGYKYTLTKGDVKKEVPDKNQHSHPADAFTYLVRYFRSGEEMAGKKVGRAPVNVPKFGNSYNIR